MVNGNVNIPLFNFQEEAVLKLIDLTGENNRQVVTVKSPTGSGKTIILINYIDEYLSNINKKTAFIWLCPGKGDLEEQSRQKMLKYAPARTAQTLFDALANGFLEETTTFINWELVTNTRNRAISEGERKNLYDRIDEARRNGIDFIIVVDEEHSNDTDRARNIIDEFRAKHIIRMSATADNNNASEFFEINELDVINEGLITKALYVNEGIEPGMEIENEYDLLIELADRKRRSIMNRYHELGKNIRPLVLIQFPNAQPESITAVETKLEQLGYTYENNMVSKWMSEEKKDLPDNLTENDAQPVFLLMKQAISTGWDCPRAKILVKLREGMNEEFEIQTVGRIRRMPEAIHYDDDLLDYCYVYTFDPTWKDGLLRNIDKAYETRRLFLKDKCKSFTLEKQLRNKDLSMMGEREVLNKVYEHLVSKYSFNNDKKQNKLLLQEAGFVFGEELISEILQGVFVRTSSLGENEDSFIETRRRVDTHLHGILLLHSVDELKKPLGLNTAKTKAILERLFRKSMNPNKKIISLDTKEFYAFIINNAKQIKIDFSEVAASLGKQQIMIPVEPKTLTFHIPENDFYKYDPSVGTEIKYEKNAYIDYSSAFTSTNHRIRSYPEHLFEEYCEKNETIDWIYKNGDSGQQYFSIVYIDGLLRQWLFYPDYIIKKTDGSIWVIETKGGEHSGHSNNIDDQIENKFNALKQYAERHDVNWGFVREIGTDLYINNTDFALEMSNPSWQPIGRVF